VAAEPVGKRLTVFSNFFKIVTDPKLILSKFTVSFQPEIPELGEQQEILLKKLFKQIST
jgi:hypothetical protein